MCFRDSPSPSSFQRKLDVIVKGEDELQISERNKARKEQDRVSCFRNSCFTIGVSRAYLPDHPLYLDHLSFEKRRKQNKGRKIRGETRVLKIRKQKTVYKENGRISFSLHSGVSLTFSDKFTGQNNENLHLENKNVKFKTEELLLLQWGAFFSVSSFLSVFHYMSRTFDTECVWLKFVFIILRIMYTRNFLKIFEENMEI